MAHIAPHTTIVSHHAAVRERQRGIARDASDLVLAHGDLLAHDRAGRVLLSLSADARDALRAEGTGAALLDRAARLILCVAEDGTLVTAMNHRERASATLRRARCGSARQRHRARRGRAGGRV